MYILTFNTSRSKYFQQGLNTATGLGGTWDGESMILKIPESRLLGAYDRLLPLFQIVGRWSSLRATFRGKEVEPYRFILMMHFIKECAGRRSYDRDHCWLYSEEEGWGCKRLSKIQYQVLGNGKYSRNDRFWYNFGRFNEKNEWVIDKETLFQHLYRHAEITGLALCPFFDVKNLNDALGRLPARIVPDDTLYRVHYEEEFYKGERVKVPLNIRHIPDQTNKQKQPPAEIERRDNPPTGRFWKRFSRN